MPQHICNVSENVDISLQNVTFFCMRNTKLCQRFLFKSSNVICVVPFFHYIYKGEIQTPDSITQFLNHMIGGPDPRWGRTSTKSRRICSIAQDLVFATTSGRYKPSKHLKVGLALKSITGSKKAITMLIPDTIESLFN